jgi:decaprenylphospho-beta-D-ribofuranose 2-oxidase
MTALNDLHYRRARVGSGQIQGFAPFFFPLDALGGWNRVYGRSGFLQYQFVVPTDRTDVVREALRALAANGITPTLAVLKRFGEASPAPLSFPLRGWTLALDIALPAPGASPVLDDIDRLVADAGGRVYLAKDSRLAPGRVREMYPRLAEWRRIRDELDPAGRLQHDLGRRLRLLEDAA